jgi:hypothetical protein
MSQLRVVGVIRYFAHNPVLGDNACLQKLRECIIYQESTNLPMTRAWLYSRFGINFVAVGLVAAFFAVTVIMIQDASFLVTGVWPKLPWYREVLYDLLAAIASVFSASSVFIFHPGLPRFVAAVVAISFGSYVVQPFVIVHHSQLTAICAARVLGFCTLLLLAWVYFANLKAGRVER